MDIRLTRKMQDVAEKMAKEGRTTFRNFRKPRWREHTLIHYEGNKEISREKICINESVIFPSDEDFFWDTKKERTQSLVG